MAHIRFLFLPVYPRWRGEHENINNYYHDSTGLSPLARGTRCVKFPCELFCRFIPAGAGNTLVYRRLPGKKPVYPRWRGEHFVSALLSSSRSGLSPLARGTLPGGTLYRPWWRFIPAGAGNTIMERAIKDERPVYPRWRGEHFICQFLRHVTNGLSPLARGTQRNKRKFYCNQRFIPAGAGNTLKRPVPRRRSPVYPRWRGEHN